MSRFAPGCICGKRMIFDDGTCHWCGRGLCSTPKTSRHLRLRRLPRDLGAFHREGRRPDPHLDNVVRLERLREQWKVPPINPVRTFWTAATLDALTVREAAVLDMVARGLPYRTIGARLGIAEGAVTMCVRRTCSVKLGCSRGEAIEWWWAQTELEEMAA